MLPPTDSTLRREKFRDSIRRCGLLDPARTEIALASLAAGANTHDVAERLILDGDLTRFQAQKLLAGQWAGLILGKYRILAPLGRGGMGVVYLAKENNSASNLVRPLIALKVLSPKKSSEERVRDRFQREMAIGHFIPPHPHVARVFDTGEANGISFIAMEYAPGRTVKEIVAEDGPMPHGEAARVFAEIADALASIHTVGLIHRDIKPSNIIVTPSGSAKLIDFGFALHFDDELHRDRAILGGRGHILGSMDYIAPEQAADATDVSAVSDLYALGATLYFALSGCPPFPGGTAIQKIRWHRNDAPPPIRSIRPEIPVELAAVVSKLMAKQPEDRYAWGTQLAEVLGHWATLPVLTPQVRIATEPSTDDLVVAEPEEPSSESNPDTTVAIPVWTPLIVAAALAVFFLAGFLVQRLAR